MRLRGLEEEHELAPQLLLRDTRTLGMKIVDFFKDPINTAFLLFAFAIASFVFAVATEIIALIAVGIFLYAITRHFKLPFRMPQRAVVLDYNDPIPGSTKLRKA